MTQLLHTRFHKSGGGTALHWEWGLSDFPHTSLVINLTMGVELVTDAESEGNQKGDSGFVTNIMRLHANECRGVEGT